MLLLVVSLIAFAATSVLCGIPRLPPRIKIVTSISGVILGSFLGIVPAAQVLSSGQSIAFTLAWDLIDLPLQMALDPLSAFFLLVTFGLAVVVAIYAWGYLSEEPHLVRTLPFFPLLIGSMELVLIAANGFWFLAAWEVMSLASFFLVVTEHDKREVRHAGWVFLVATHLGTAFLLLFFVILSSHSGSMGYDSFRSLQGLPSATAGFLFILALVGFGTKAGIYPFHTWLPQAHPAAPTYISALMSGVMIKTGIYGLLRAVTFLGIPSFWWGGLLIILGMVSALLGVLNALMQHDLKRLLAYHSVENIGIIVIGIGLALLGSSTGQPTLVYWGLAGALFHVLNHGIFKGALFLAAGGVLQRTHTRSIDRLGGVIRWMPLTASCFLVGAAAICGLPPLNGFFSEWVLYVGLFKSTQLGGGWLITLTILGLLGLAFAGGLAVACFAKAMGVVFLGEPRHIYPHSPRELPTSMLTALVILTLLSIGIGIFPVAALKMVLPAVQMVLPAPLSPGFGGLLSALQTVNRVVFLLIGIFILIGLAYLRLFHAKTIRRAVTWDCGYHAPNARMQYSASSFAEPFGYFFQPLLGLERRMEGLTGYFPSGASFEEHAGDVAEEKLFVPLFSALAGLMARVRAIQRSRVQVYLILIFVALFLLLFWEVWFGF